MQRDISPVLAGPEQWADFFDRSGEAVVVMQMAQRMQLTFQEAQVRIPSEAIDAEVGFAMYQSEKSARSCPSCGTDPDDMDTLDGKSALEPKWKLVRCECAICFENSESMKAEKESQGEQGDTVGIYFRRVPRGEGEAISARLAGGHGVFDD